MNDNNGWNLANRVGRHVKVFRDLDMAEEENHHPAHMGSCVDMQDTLVSLRQQQLSPPTHVLPVAHGDDPGGRQRGDWERSVLVSADSPNTLA